MATLSSRQLQERLRAIERERADLHRRMDTLAKLPEEMELPPARPRLRPAALPDEWENLHPDNRPASRAAERPGRRVEGHVAAAVAPGVTAEFSPPPSGVRMVPGAPSGRRTMPNPDTLPTVGEANPPDKLGAYLGSQSALAKRHHLRRPVPEGSYRARAVFAVAMVILLGFLAIRLFAF